MAATAAYDGGSGSSAGWSPGGGSGQPAQDGRPQGAAGSGERDGRQRDQQAPRQPRARASERALAGLAHLRERGVPVGEELDLQRGLVDEQVEAPDEHGSALAGGACQRSGPGVVEHLEEHRRVEQRDQLGALRCRRHRGDHHVGVHRLRGQRQCLDPGRRGVRADRVDRLSRALWGAGQHPHPGGALLDERQRGRRRGGPAAEHDHVVDDAGPALAHRGGRAGQVGVVRQPAGRDVVAEHQGVGGPHQAGPVGDRAGEVEQLALERHGQRQPAPRRVQPAQEVGEGPARHAHRLVGPTLQTEPVVRRPVQHRRQRVVDGVAEHGAAHRSHRRAQQRSDWVSQYSSSSRRKPRNSS